MAISKISLNATGPISTICHVELLLTEDTKICLNSSGRMTNISAMPMHGENL